VANGPKIKDFRDKLLNDAQFRQSFAADPAGAIRGAGIDIPNDVQLPAIDHAEFEARIQKLKTLMGTEGQALSRADTTDDARDAVAKAPTINSTGNFAVLDPKKVGRTGNVFTISAFGTLDW